MNPELLASALSEHVMGAVEQRSPVPEFLEGENGLEPSGTGPSQAELEAAEPDTRNWLYQTQSYAGTRYSSLDQVNLSNVDRLAPVCAYQVGELRNFQTNPIIYDEVMYLTTLHYTVAIDATTCRPMGGTGP
jgi:glucose dehydrogenase